MGRPAPEHDRRGELPGLPGGRHGPGDDERVPSAGRALRHPLHHRRRDEVELTDGGVQTVKVGKDAYLAEDRDPVDGRRAEAARYPGRDGARRQRRLHLRCLRRRLLQGRGRRRDRRRRLGDGGLDLRLEVRRQARSSTAATSTAPRRSCRSAPRARTTSSSPPRSPSRSSSPATTASSSRPPRRTPRPASRGLEVGGAFVAIGHPRSELVKGQVDLDDKGYVKVEELLDQDEPRRRLRGRRPRRQHLPAGSDRRRVRHQGALDAE